MRLDATISARQLDLDRMLRPTDGPRRLPLATLRALVETYGGTLRLPFPVKIGLAADTVILSAATLQTVRGQIESDGDGWIVGPIELRAPGFAQVRFSGRIAARPQGMTFAGPAEVEAADPKAFMTWLEGAARSGAGVDRAAQGRRRHHSRQRPLRGRADAS